MTRSAAALTFLALINAAPCLLAQDPLQVFHDPDATPEARAANLVSQMTLEEKASQMQNTAVAIPRLGIPAYDWWNEGLHGVARAGLATVFPQATGLAATFDTNLMHNVASTISTEARGKYNDAIAHDNHGRYFGLTFWSPNINIFRDPRWGRGQETYGEDPFLTSRMAVAFIRGLQGDDQHYFKTIATAKHFAVHSGPELTRHSFDVHPSEEDLRDTYLPAFQASIVEAKAYSVMCAYNSFEGAPACGSTTLLGDYLHKAWGFQGYIVSDCGAIGDFVVGHKYSPNMPAADAAAVKAGTDLDCGKEYKQLTDAVHQSLIAESEVNRALERLFVARIRLGMFDPPERVPFSKLGLQDVASEGHRRLALAAARESMVLLRNQGGVLPLKAAKVAVIGPTAFDPDALLGNYNGIPPRIVTPLEGLENQWGVASVKYALGATYESHSAALIPPGVLSTVDGRRGLTAEYFDDDDFSDIPNVQRVEDGVYFRWDMQDPVVVATTSRERFAARWTGQIQVAETGEYQLGFTRERCGDCTGQDSARLYLDDQLLIGDETRVAWMPSTKTKAMRLIAGEKHSLRLEYTQKGGAAAIELVWVPDPEVALKEAAAAARAADAVVVCLGLNSSLEGEESPLKIPGFEGGDRTTMALPDTQLRLWSTIQSLHLTKPVVLVLLNGSSVDLPPGDAAAVLEAWYPGGDGGTALAETLSGKNNPAGRLPVTFYQSVAQLPAFDDYSMKGRTYRYFTGKPTFPFGYGLSYSDFRYSDLAWEKKPSGDLEVTAKVKNASSVEGDEVVQLYLNYPHAGTGMQRELRGFTRIHLLGGETQTVHFTLELAKLHKLEATVSVGAGQPLRDFTGDHFVEKPLDIR
jgi:beta-glucosidase